MQRRQKFEIKGLMIQYNIKVDTQSPNDYKKKKKKLQTGWELCFTEMTEHKSVEF